MKIAKINFTRNPIRINRPDPDGVRRTNKETPEQPPKSSPKKI